MMLIRVLNVSIAIPGTSVLERGRRVVHVVGGMNGRAFSISSSCSKTESKEIDSTTDFD
jgi:hypothetical protein